MFNEIFYKLNNLVNQFINSLFTHQISIFIWGWLHIRRWSHCRRRTTWWHWFLAMLSIRRMHLWWTWASSWSYMGSHILSHIWWRHWWWSSIWHRACRASHHTYASSRTTKSWSWPHHLIRHAHWHLCSSTHRSSSPHWWRRHLLVLTNPSSNSAVGLTWRSLCTHGDNAISSY
jgi:hypothetical protein